VQVTSFRSPNRSILDESDDFSTTENEETNEIVVLGDGNRILNESECLDSSFLQAGPAEDVEFDNTKVLQKYSAALDEANATIRRLHSALKEGNKGSDLLSDVSPVVAVPSLDIDLPFQKKDSSPSNKEYRTVNVRMLDGENFITDWTPMEPLSAPPEHDLRSPIVTAVLDAWTGDERLHTSLLSWMDQVISGHDPESIPPLTLSSLDHQARDGFALHVLPLLLLRPDVRVGVKTRAQRQTSYDLSVAVDSIENRDVYFQQREQDLERTSGTSDVGSFAANSSATTAVASNTIRRSVNINAEEFGRDESYVSRHSHSTSAGIVSSRFSYDEVTEDISSSDDHSPGLISTLGGALGGLLTRRKDTAGLESLPHNGPHGTMQTIFESPPSASLVAESVRLAEGDSDDDQPFHRIVSAPAGRIGVTFVEYRGHCMVSDVSPDSPLTGWIFPSDVLIAIDELPVSGMRIRDIIKVLKDRSDRQRAMRVISSHAANELTVKADSTSDYSN
jgi:hypothetical protein